MLNSHTATSFLKTSARVSCHARLSTEHGFLFCFFNMSRSSGMRFELLCVSRGWHGLLRHGLCDGEESHCTSSLCPPHPVSSLFWLRMFREQGFLAAAGVSPSVPFSHRDPVGRWEGRGSDVEPHSWIFVKETRNGLYVPWPRTDLGISAGAAGVRADHGDRWHLYHSPPASEQSRSLVHSAL